MFNYRTIILVFFWVTIFGQSTVYAKSTYSVAVESGDSVAYYMFDSLAKELGTTFEFVEFDSFSDALSSVSSGDLDLMANITYSESRARKFDFSAPTNIEYVYLYTVGGSPLSELQTIGIQEGKVYDLAIYNEFPEIQFIKFKNTEEALELLNTGKVDAVIDGLNQLETLMLAGTNAILINDYLSLRPASVVAPKGKFSVLLKRIEKTAHSAKFQKALREFTEDHQLQIRMQALRKEVVNERVNVNEPVRVKLENINLFANYYNDGSVNGMSADILFNVCDVLQLNCQLVSDANESWSSMYESLENQTIDILSPLAITESRKEKFYFSAPYYSPQIILVKRTNYKNGVYHLISEMVAERIGVVEGNFFQSLLMIKLPGKKLHLYPSQSQLLDGLLNNEVDYILVTRASFYSKLRDSGNVLNVKEDNTVGVVYSYDLAFGFPNTEKGKLLSELFSSAMSLIDLNSIITKYYYPLDWYATINAQKKFSRNSTLSSTIVILSLVLIMVFFYKRTITDELTQLKNRLAIYRKYSKTFSVNKTLVYLDVNKFKSINDTYGHIVGDLVLKHLSNIIKCDWQGEAYRIGGDEFVLVSKESLEKIEYQLKNIRSFVFVDKSARLEFVVTTSVGMAESLTQSLPLDEVLHTADKSMYKSKARFRQSQREL